MNSNEWIELNQRKKERKKKGRKERRKKKKTKKKGKNEKKIEGSITIEKKRIKKIIKIRNGKMTKEKLKKIKIKRKVGNLLQ